MNRDLSPSLHDNAYYDYMRNSQMTSAGHLAMSALWTTLFTLSFPHSLGTGQK